MKRALLCLLCLFLLSFAACQKVPSAASPSPSPSPLPVPSAAVPSEWPELPVYIDGLLRLRAYDCEGTLFLCPEDVCALFDLPAEAEIGENGCRLQLEAWTLEAPAGESIFTADGRYLYCPEGYRVIEGRFALPSDAVERLFGLQILQEPGRVVIDASRRQLLEGGENYYLTHFHADDLFWLSHIIYAEAHWEPLEGQIGVGCVVLNRVKSDLFPATVMAVVLDREHEIQFSPVETGEVLAEPDEQAMLAACLCLEGYNPVGDSLYFMNPETGDGTWFEHALNPTVTIGHHQFYS